MSALNCLYHGSPAVPEQQGQSQHENTASATDRTVRTLKAKRTSCALLEGSCFSGSCPSVSSSSKDKLMKADKVTKTSDSQGIFLQRIFILKNEEAQLKVFQLSKRWDSVEKRIFLLKIILLTENFSTENQSQQDPFQTSHILGQHLLFLGLRSSWSEGTVVARPGCAGEMELLLIPSSHPKKSEQGHMQRGCSGAQGDALSLCCLSWLAAFHLIHPHFVLVLSKRLFRLPVQVILPPHFSSHTKRAA